MVVKKPRRKLIFVTLLSDADRKYIESADTSGKLGIFITKGFDLSTQNSGLTNTKGKAALLLFGMSRKKIIQIVKTTP
jgi:hypothetical protein